MRTEICLTIDTEFSVAGAFQHPTRYPPLSDEVVRCEVGGKEQGLGFILETLAKYECHATFFVEALNSIYFGDEPMKRVAERILAAGHDVQLHLHPLWQHFRDPNWQENLATDPDDSCAGRSREASADTIASGLAAFRRWGVPDPIAIRTGNLKVDREFYAALEPFGIRLTSNLGIGVFRPHEPGLQLAGGRHWIGGILEVPVLTYTDPRIGRPDHQRCLTIAATSWSETRHLLWQARRAGVSPIVVLTHPFEFVKQWGFRYESLHRNRINQNRLTRLLEFIHQHDRDFVAVTFRDRAKEWLASETTPDPALSVPAVLVLRRMVENGVNDLILQY